MIISCCADVVMNDECTKGREKRDDNHSSRRSRRFARFGLELSMKVLVLVINVALAYTAVPLRLDGYTSSMGMVVVSSSKFPHCPRRLARFGTFFSLLLIDRCGK